MNNDSKWVAIAGAAVMLIAATGIIDSNESATITANLTQALNGTIGLVVAITAIVKRIKAGKKAEAEAKAAAIAKAESVAKAELAEAEKADETEA